MFDFTGLPRFDAIRPEHIAPAIDRLLEEAQTAVRRSECATPATWEQVVVPLDDACDRLWRAWGQVVHLQTVANTPELREAYNTQLPKATRFASDLAQNQRLYAQYRALAAAPGAEDYDQARRSRLDHALRDFRLGGADLDADDKARMAQIHEELSALSAKFSQNALDATDAWSLYVDDAAELSGLPDDLLAACRAAAQRDGRPGWKLSLQTPCHIAVQNFADDRTLRERLYRAYATRASELGADPAFDNGPLIERILALRAEQAWLLGFADYAEYSLATKMADSPAQVLDFVRDMADKAMPFARRDHADLQDYARQALGLPSLEPWDVAWAGEKLRQARHGYSAQEVRQYFTEPKVLEGLFAIVHSLYRIRFEPDSAPVWHPDVRFYRVLDADGRLLGQFYLDLYAREGKHSGAWMGDCRKRRQTGGGVQTPVAYVVCNFARGGDGKAATFQHEEVLTLFHELGHALHLLLTEIGELGVSGMSGVEWDAVELPSQFMENFCWEWDSVRALTAHADDGRPMPRELFDRLLAARNFLSGMTTVRQLEFALFDMLLHSGYVPGSGGVLALLERVRDEVAVVRPPAWQRFPHQFGHIFAGSYAAGYYSYKWAEVLSADAYDAFETTWQTRAETGDRFRREVLARGSSRPMADSFRAFRGRDPHAGALLRHLGLQATPTP